MKKIIAILLTIVCLTVVCCGCGAKTSEQNEGEYTPTISEEIDTSKNEPADEITTAEDVKNQLATTLESLGDTSGFTNEKTEASNGSTTHSFSYFLEKVSASIVETDEGIQQISCLAFVSSFTETGFSDAEALNFAAKLCVTPMIALGEHTTTDSLYQNIVSSTPEIEDDSATYTYEEDGCFYILTANDTMVIAMVKPVV